MKKTLGIIFIVAFACALMGVVDAIIQPGYLVKSIIKIALFLILPALYAKFNKVDLKRLFIPNKKGILTALLLGIGVFLVIILGYNLVKGIFDFSNLTKSLEETTGVNKSNFIFVAIYISFINSLLEEFFFRGFAFLELKKEAGKKVAHIVSASFFALYHIAMMIGWFGAPVVIISLIGLFVGGIIFNLFNERSENIYHSWLIHMFSNFAINSIGIMLMA